eukprot:31962-Prymnesium_polylepis.1
MASRGVRGAVFDMHELPRPSAGVRAPSHVPHTAPPDPRLSQPERLNQRSQPIHCGRILCPDRAWPHSLPIHSPLSAGR